MKKLLVVLFCALAPCFIVACKNDESEPSAGPWANYHIDTNSCLNFKEGFDYFKYENELSLVLPNLAGVNCESRYSYFGMINILTKKEWDDFKVGYPEFVFENFENENIIRVYGESYFIFGTTEYVLENPVFQLSEKVEEGVKTYKAVCGNTTLLTVNIKLSETADESFYGVVLQQIQNSLTVL